MGGALSRSAECRCEENGGTCGHCLRNAKPWLFTPTDNSWMWKPAMCKYLLERAALLYGKKGYES